MYVLLFARMPPVVWCMKYYELFHVTLTTVQGLLCWLQGSMLASLYPGAGFPTSTTALAILTILQDTFPNTDAGKDTFPHTDAGNTHWVHFIMVLCFNMSVYTNVNEMQIKAKLNLRFKVDNFNKKAFRYLEVQGIFFPSVRGVTPH